MVAPNSKTAQPKGVLERADLKPLLSDLQRPGSVWRILLDALPVLVSYIDPDHHYVFNNRAYEDWFGCNRDDIRGRHVSEVVGEVVYALIKPKLDEGLAGKTVTFDRVNPYRSGGERFIRATYVPDFAESGAVRGLFALIEDLTDLQQAKEELLRSRDTLAEQVLHRTAELRAANAQLVEEIAERSRAERALAEKERLLTEVVETAPSLVVLTDHEGRIVLFNRACETLTGYRQNEVIGRTVIEAFIPDEWKDIVWRSFTAPDPDRLRLPQQFPWLTRSGEPRFIEWRCALVPSVEGDGPGILGIGVDITERHLAEQLTREQQSELARVLRVNTLGEMASTLAHELNQPLSAILGYTQGAMRMIRRGETSGDALEDCLAKAAGQASRAGDIIQHIRRYVRRGDPHRIRAPINDLVREAAVLMTTEASTYRIAVRLDLDPAEPLVFVERVAIEQVVINLFQNSVEALRDAGTSGGWIELSTGVNDEGAVEVRVLDNGPGVPGGLRDRLFEPFVTAKRDGMGLGLPMCRSIVRDHGGELWLGNGGPDGAQFRFTLPASPAPDDAEP